MKRKVLTLVAALGALAGSLCLAGELPPRLILMREQAEVSGELIRTKDVARLGAGLPERLAELSLGNSPWPGNVREISRALLKVRLVSAGFDLQELQFSGSETCEVRLSSIRVPSEEIVAAARSALTACFPQGGPEVEAELLRQPAAVLLPARGGEPELRPSMHGSGPLSGTVRVDVEVVRDGTRLKRVPVSFGVRLYDRVVVSRREIAPGEKFSRANAVLVRREVGGVHGRCFRGIEGLAGRAATRTIRAGQIITDRITGEAEQPIVIDRNQRVFLIVETETLRVVTLGQALAVARKGEIARAKNLTTGREVVGVASAPGILRVPLGGPENAQ